jgi:hypothetical protein
MMQGWKLARAWYEDRLRPSWRPKSAEEARRAFEQIGLAGDFWRLA